MTHPSDAQRPRWGFTTRVRNSGVDLVLRLEADKLVDALEADLGRALEENERLTAQLKRCGGNNALTPAADHPPIARSRSQAKRLTVQTGIEHIAAADAAEGGKG